jgi:hypothetical protein
VPFASFSDQAGYLEINGKESIPFNLEFIKKNTGKKKIQLLLTRD